MCFYGYCKIIEAMRYSRIIILVLIAILLYAYEVAVEAMGELRRQREEDFSIFINEVKRIRKKCKKAAERFDSGHYNFQFFFVIAYNSSCSGPLVARSLRNRFSTLLGAMMTIRRVQSFSFEPGAE